MSSCFVRTFRENLLWNIPCPSRAKFRLFCPEIWRAMSSLQLNLLDILDRALSLPLLLLDAEWAVLTHFFQKNSVLLDKRICRFHSGKGHNLLFHCRVDPYRTNHFRSRTLALHWMRDQNKQKLVRDSSNYLPKSFRVFGRLKPWHTARTATKNQTDTLIIIEATVECNKNRFVELKCSGKVVCGCE